MSLSVRLCSDCRFWWPALVLVVGCGGGDGGGMEPRAEATLIGPTFTAKPGEVKSADLALRTNEAAAGIQVDIVTRPEVITSVEGVQSAGRAAALQGSAFQNLSPGRTRILLFDDQGSASIPAGEGSVLTVSFQISPTAAPGISAIGLEGGLVIDEEGATFVLTLEPGEITVQP